MATNLTQHDPDTHSATALTAVDAHVHFYDFFDPGAALDCAHANFRQAVTEDGALVAGVLLFAEKQEQHHFERLADGSLPASGWHFERLAEPCTLRAQRGDGAVLLLVAGCQVRCAEGIEVLALCCNERIPDGGNVEAVLEACNAAGALTVVAWGVGKWTGKRRHLVQRLLDDTSLPPFLLGDNSGRLGMWPRPALFAYAERCGRKVLPGSDPLPHRSECWRPGSYGFALNARLDADRPAADLCERLRAPATRIRPFGQAEGPTRFVLNQLRAQIRRRLRS